MALSNWCLQSVCLRRGGTGPAVAHPSPTYPQPPLSDCARPFWTLVQRPRFRRRAVPTLGVHRRGAERCFSLVPSSRASVTPILAPCHRAISEIVIRARVTPCCPPPVRVTECHQSVPESQVGLPNPGIWALWCLMTAPHVLRAVPPCAALTSDIRGVPPASAPWLAALGRRPRGAIETRGLPGMFLSSECVCALGFPPALPLSALAWRGLAPRAVVAAPRALAAPKRNRLGHPA